MVRLNGNKPAGRGGLVERRHPSGCSRPAREANQRDLSASLSPGRVQPFSSNISTSFSQKKHGSFNGELASLIGLDTNHRNNNMDVPLCADGRPPRTTIPRSSATAVFLRVSKPSPLRTPISGLYSQEIPIWVMRNASTQLGRR